MVGLVVVGAIVVFGAVVGGARVVVDIRPTSNDEVLGRCTQ